MALPLGVYDEVKTHEAGIVDVRHEAGYPILDCRRYASGFPLEAYRHGAGVDLATVSRCGLHRTLSHQRQATDDSPFESLLYQQIAILPIQFGTASMVFHCNTGAAINGFGDKVPVVGDGFGLGTGHPG